jgi:hypothetical protein
MPTIEDLGRKVKAKYPGIYDDLSDTELGERIKAKYPGYDDFTDMRVAHTNSMMGQVIEYSTDAQTIANVQSLLDYYSPKRGRLSSWWQRGKAESRGRLVAVLSQEQWLVIQQGAILADAIRNRTKSDSDFQIYLAQNAQVLLELRLKEVLIETALRQGLTVETDQRLKLESGLSGIRINEHRQVKDIDLYVRATEYQQDQENVSRIQQEKLELIDRASHRLYSFYEQRKQLEASDDPAKDDKLTHLNKLIHGAERLILGEQDRYIQATLGEEAPRGLPAHDSGTGDSEAAKADEI